MAPKSKGRSWIDIQIAIITISLALVLGLWNLFAGVDRVKAERKAAEAMANPPEPVVTEAPVAVEVVPVAPVVPELGTKIILGDEAPQTVVTVERVIRRSGGGGGGDGGSSGGGGGGGGGATSTKSS